MAINNFAIRGVVQRFSIEPDQIKAVGGAASPYLQIPLFLDLHPIAGSNIPNGGGITSFVLTNIEASMILPGFQFKTAETYKICNRQVKHKNSFYLYLDFPLTKEKILVIENHRKGNLSISLHLDFHFGIFGAMPFNTNYEPEKMEFITEYGTSDANVVIEISQSQWVTTMLPGLGFQGFEVIEMPSASELIPGKYKASLTELTEAQKYFGQGDYDKVVAHCRSALDPFNKVMPELKEFILSKSEFEWIDKINSSTFDWLDTLWKQTKNFTSKAHHPPSTGHFDRHDAQIIYMVTTAIVAYIGTIDSQKEI